MSPESATVEIVTVGRELLTGHTVDTNSAWIAARLTEAGALVRRIVTVDDEPAAIAHEIVAARTRGAAVVITTGGLGPTSDDRTLAGVASAFGRRLGEHPEALAFVARRYAELAAADAVADGGLTAPRRKMASLPEGAEPIENAVGTAPGIFLVAESVAVVALPGVPAEMRAVFEAAMPRIRARLGSAGHVAEREVSSGSGDESVLTVATERVMDAMPGVCLKSLATAFSPSCDLRVRITARATSAAEAEALVARASDRLAAELAGAR